jgi:hypothetical protein
MFFWAHLLPGGAERTLKSLGLGPDVAVVSKGWIPGQERVQITLLIEDERLPHLRALLQQHGKEPLESTRDVYTDEELDSARLLIVWTHNDVDVLGGPRLGTTYDMSSACPSCGAGARQSSAMVIDKDNKKTLKKLRATATSYEDMLVDEGLAAQLASSDLTGFSFQDVYSATYHQDPKTRPKESAKTKLPWKQVIATHTMPPMSPLSTGFEPAKCQACKRGGVHTMNIPTRIVYHAKDLAGIQDFNTTWEWFEEIKFNGDVSNALFPYPWFLVTPKVMHFFRDAGVKSFDWIPIRVVEDE